MESARRVTAGRLRRLTEELVDEHIGAIERSSAPDALVDEIDYALRPPRHERRVPSYGSFVLPTTPSGEWQAGTGLDIAIAKVTDRADEELRRYADGLTSWTVRMADGIDAFVVFDRSAGSERDLVVLAAVTGATVVQRHPNGEVRVVSSFGVARWDGIGWHIEPPVESWLITACEGVLDEGVSERLLWFAVHDLGARGIGALFVAGPSDPAASAFERRLPEPPPLSILRPETLGPLRHVLGQIDGAVVFDRAGTVLELGVRIVPSAGAEEGVAPLGGTRHTTARRYSYDDPGAVVIAVSESGPVTVFRGGEIVGRSTPADAPADG